MTEAPIRSHAAALALACTSLLACTRDDAQRDDPLIAVATTGGTSSTAADAHTTDDDTAADESTSTSNGDPGADLGDLPEACGADATWPEPDWTVGDAAAHGFDPTALEDAAAYAESEESHCLLVVKNGELIFERYFGQANADMPMKSWSVAKSHVAAIVGIALGRGELGSLDDSIATYLPELADDPRAAITLRSLLTMTAGVYAGVLEDMAGMFSAKDMTAKALATTAQSEPGTAWEYSNVAVQLFDPIFRQPARSRRAASRCAGRCVLRRRARWAGDRGRALARPRRRAHGSRGRRRSRGQRVSDPRDLRAARRRPADGARRDRAPRLGGPRVNHAPL